MIASVLAATQAVGFVTLLRIFDPSLPLHAEMTTRGFHFTVLRLWAKVRKSMNLAAWGIRSPRIS
jgi:hypothetical protein